MFNQSSRAVVAAVLPLALGALCSSAAAASPGVVSGAPGFQYSYVAEPGTDSGLTISGAGGAWVFTDAAVSEITITAAQGCRHGAARNVVVCEAESADPAPELLYADLGDGDDRAMVDATALTMTAGANWIHLNGNTGDDFLVAGDQADTRLNGGPGNDVAIGGARRDALFGQGGADIMRGGGGADIVDGGADRDSFTYAAEGRTKGVRAVLDGTTPSGTEGIDGSGDQLTGIEDVGGTPYTDILVGNASNNVLRGNGGVDQLTGLAGDDTLITSGGPSWLDGGDGNDLLQAKNTFKDMLGCGNGADTAKVDPTELFVPFASCETLTG